MDIRENIWTEKYRPSKFQDIKGQEKIVERVEALVKLRNIPHLLFTGPPGIGKCISKDTPILAGDGSLITIEEAYQNKIKNVMSLDISGKIKKSEIDYFYKNKSEYLIKLKTQSGNYIKVTPEHPVLALREGTPLWIESQEIKTNDLIAIPTKYNIKGFKHTINLDKIKKYFWCKLKKEILVDVFKSKQGVQKKILECISLKEKITVKELIKNIKHPQQTISLNLRRLLEENKIELVNKNKPYLYKITNKKVKTKEIPLEYVKDYKNIDLLFYKSLYHPKSGYIKFFKTYSSDFFEILGIILSDGHIKNTINIFNNNVDLLNKYKILLVKVFGKQIFVEIKSKRSNPKNKYLTIKKGATISKLISLITNLPIGKKKSNTIKVPSELYNSSLSEICAFIRGFYEGDGSFPKNNHIEIGSDSKDFIIGLKYLFTRLSIFSMIRVKNNRNYVLKISGSENINKFKKYINPEFKKINYNKNDNTNIDILEINKKDIIRILRQFNIKYNDLGNKKGIECLLSRQRGSRKKVLRIYKKIGLICRSKLKKSLATISLLESIDVNIEEDLNDCFNKLKDKEIRYQVNKNGIRTDRLKEYSDKKREPNLSNLLKIVKTLSEAQIVNPELYTKLNKILFAKEHLISTITELGITYNEIGASLNMHPSSANYIINQKELSNSSVLNLSKIYKTIKNIVEKRIYNIELISKLEAIDFLCKAEIRWDKVVNAEKIDGDVIYDLNVKNTHNFIGGFGPLVLHNSTLALVTAKELFGESWHQNFIELNASDERGIDTVRGIIKDFARVKPIGDFPFKIIFLDEADNLTKDAQQALRRTMETFAQSTRFVISCNYSSKIIDPILSRCTVFRFKPLEEKDIKIIINNIAQKENLKISEEAVKALFKVSEGDCRKLENVLQSCAAIDSNINEDLVFSLVSAARPKEIKEIMEIALAGDFLKSREKLLDTMLKYGLSGLDTIKQIQKEIWSLEIPEDKKVYLIDKCGEIEFRIVEGSDEFVQIESFLANLILVNKK